MVRMPAPAMLVSDGSPGLAKAARAVWPGTRVQRCTFHAANQVKRCTTLNPRLDAGIELLGIANRLKDAKDAESATAWLLEYNAWCVRWESFLKEFTIKPSSTLIGKTLRDFRNSTLPSSAVLAMIFRGNDVITPNGDTELKEGDVVAAIVTPASEEQIKPYFG
jgi:hypothetical protein